MLVKDRYVPSRKLSVEEERNLLNKRFWENLDYILGVKAMSMSALSEKLGYSVQSIRSSKYKMNEIKLSFALNVARVLNVSLSDLIYTPMLRKATEVPVKETRQKAIPSDFFTRLNSLTDVQAESVMAHALAFFDLNLDKARDIIRSNSRNEETVTDVPQEGCRVLEEGNRTDIDTEEVTE